MYKDWGEKFYPKKMKDRDKLNYLAQHFDTVEINATFYRMPQEKTFKLWQDKAEEFFPHFIYTVKLSKYITHRKKLILDDESKPFLREFIKRSRNLGQYAGAILLQIPPGWHEDNKRLDEFLAFLTKYNKRMKFEPDLAIELRHASWFNDETYYILRKYNTAFVAANSSRWPSEKVITADFSYIRLHGPKELFASSYSHRELGTWKRFINSHKDEVRRFYVYFNNDYSARAIENAKYLQETMGIKKREL
jgi:uncharacterized protein YecE (DUF72 family)